jgi:hypothetical protein
VEGRVVRVPPVSHPLFRLDHHSRSATRVTEQGGRCCGAEEGPACKVTQRHCRVERHRAGGLPLCRVFVLSDNHTTLTSHVFIASTPSSLFLPPPSPHPPLRTSTLSRTWSRGLKLTSAHRSLVARESDNGGWRQRRSERLCERRSWKNLISKRLGACPRVRARASLSLSLSRSLPLSLSPSLSLYQISLEILALQ